MGLWPLACWDCGFELRRIHELTLVSVVRYEVEDSSEGQSLVQRSPTECVGVSLGVLNGNNNALRLKRGGGRGQTMKEKWNKEKALPSC